MKGFIDLAHLFFVFMLFFSILNAIGAGSMQESLANKLKAFRDASSNLALFNSMLSQYIKQLLTSTSQDSMEAGIPLNPGVGAFIVDCGKIDTVDVLAIYSKFGLDRFLPNERSKRREKERAFRDFLREKCDNAAGKYIVCMVYPGPPPAEIMPPCSSLPEEVVEVSGPGAIDGLVLISHKEKYYGKGCVATISLEKTANKKYVKISFINSGESELCGGAYCCQVI